MVDGKLAGRNCRLSFERSFSQEPNKVKDDASAGPVSSHSEQSNRKPNGETAGVDLEQSKGASMCADCTEELAGAVHASMSICGDGELAGVACTQCQSLCRECATCLAASASVGCCISCPEKKK